MELDKLVHMANRIGEFFDSFPDRAQAVAGVSDHLIKFWTPAMRQQLQDAVDRQQAKGLSPLVAQALTKR